MTLKNRLSDAQIDHVAKEILKLYGEEAVPLHRPIFKGNEKHFLVDCVESNFVSTAGAQVTAFEDQICLKTGAKFSVAVCSGTAALHLALVACGVSTGDDVLTQPLTFVGTCNAISHAGASPIFIDVDKNNLGLMPSALERYLDTFVEKRDGRPWNRYTKRYIGACVPVHLFGFSCDITEIVEICSAWGIPVVEDAAEAMGTYKNEKHLGTFGSAGIISFNGNKIVTTGGGGAVTTNSQKIAQKVRHLASNAKVDHPYFYDHDQVGFNYRMPAINASLGLAQLENLNAMIEIKQEMHQWYADLFAPYGLKLLTPKNDVNSNYWLNTLVLQSKVERNNILEAMHKLKVGARPAWKLMNRLRMYNKCHVGKLENATELQDKILNLPSSVPVTSSFA